LYRSGEVFLSNALIEGKFALRLCGVNFRTSQEDIKALPGMISRLGREVDAQLRASELGGAPQPA
jgi:aromatic-L-amino-acid decarboxylase